MINLEALKAKISALRTEVVINSISPLRLGCILDEMLEKLNDAYRGNLSSDLQDAFATARAMLDKAEAALDVLEKAIALLLDSLQVVVVDRGIYDPAASYYFAELNPATGVVETSDVWFCGCRWRCLVSGTTQQPSWKATHWLLIEGNSQFSVDFAPVNTVFRIGAVDLKLRIIASIHNQDVTADVLPMDVVWTRYSEDADGTPRTASDNVWNAAHAGAGHAVHITDADLDFNGRIPHVIRFSAEATLRDGAVEPAVASLSLFDLN